MKRTMSLGAAWLLTLCCANMQAMAADTPTEPDAPRIPQEVRSLVGGTDTILAFKMLNQNYAAMVIRRSGPENTSDNEIVDSVPGEKPPGAFF